MAVNDPTTNFDWDLPTDGGSTDAWGDLLNEALGEALDSVDADIAAVQTDLDTLESDIEDLDERVRTLEAQGNRPIWARVLMSSNQSISKDSDTTLTWDTEDEDHGDLFDSGSPSRLTIPATRSGLFDIRATVRVPVWTGAGDDGREWTVTILKNGNPLAFGRFPYMNDAHHSEDTGHRTIEVATLDVAAADDYFEVRAHYDYHDLGDDTAPVQADGTAFEVVALHAVAGLSDLPVAPDLHVAARFVTARSDGEQILTSDVVDQSENAYTCDTVQGTITWDAELSALNDQPAFDYIPGGDATTTFIEMLTQGGIDLTEDFTMFAVVDADNTGSTNRDILNHGDGSGPDTRTWKEGDVGGLDVPRVFRTGGGDEKGDGTVRFGNLFVQRIDDGAVEWWMDGDKETASGSLPSDAGDVTSSQNVVIGGHRTDSSNGGAWSRRILEIVVYTRVLSDSERSQVESFLADLYDITL